MEPTQTSQSVRHKRKCHLHQPNAPKSHGDDHSVSGMREQADGQKQMLLMVEEKEELNSEAADATTKNWKVEVGEEEMAASERGSTAHGQCRGSPRGLC